MGIHKNKYSIFNIHEETPICLYEKLNQEFNFNFDPCPFHSEKNGLNIEWVGNAFVNPPYGRGVKNWIKKALEELKKQLNIAVFLLPAYTDTRLFHDVIFPFSDEIRFLRGRLFFGEHKERAPFGSMVVIFK